MNPAIAERGRSENHGSVYLLSRECAMEVVEDLSGVVAVGERIYNFRCEFGQNRWIQKGCEDLLCKIWEYCGPISCESILRCEVVLIQTVLRV